MTNGGAVFCKVYYQVVRNKENALKQARLVIDNELK